MNIKKHVIWKGISPYKKPFHLFRFFLAKNVAKIYPSSNFIGITGSVGKTTATQACLAVLSEKFNTIATNTNLDPILNIPITILRIRPGVEKVLLEMGIEYPGEMDFYLSLVRPSTAVVTRIFFAHSEFLGDINKIVEEKGNLVKQLPKDGFAILNWDDPHCRKLSDFTEAKIIFYGTDPKECNVWASRIRIEDEKSCFELNHGVERAEVRLKLLGRHFIYPALAAAALGINCGISLTRIKRGLEKMETVSHRLQLLEGACNSRILDDTHNSSPAAVEEALNVLQELPARRRIAVLGEMKELGVYSEKLHRQVARQIIEKKIDYVILGGGDARFIGDELVKCGFLPERLEVNLSNSQIVSKILRHADKDDLILVKGSRAVKLDEVVGRIKKTT